MSLRQKRMEKKRTMFRPKIKWAFVIWLCLLCATSGLINVSALCLYDAKVTHHTGNLSVLAMEFWERDSARAGFICALIFAFFAGSFVCGLLFRDRQFKVGRRYGVVLLILGTVCIALRLGTVSSSVMVLYLALMMGMQNGLFIFYKGLMIRSSHFTGYLTDAGFVLAAACMGDKDALRKFFFLSVSILSFLLGGFAAAAFYSLVAFDIWYLVGFVYIFLALYYFIFRKDFV